MTYWSAAVIFKKKKKDTECSPKAAMEELTSVES